jgi:hypothetical protein
MSNNVTYNYIALHIKSAINITASIGPSSVNRIHHNEFIGNNVSGKQAWDEAGGNYWNDTTVGNHWSDYDETPEGCYDNTPADGTCDAAYMIPGGTGAQDYHPIALPSAPDLSDAAIVLLMTLIIILFTMARRRRL